MQIITFHRFSIFLPVLLRVHIMNVGGGRSPEGRHFLIARRRLGGPATWEGHCVRPNYYIHGMMIHWPDLTFFSFTLLLLLPLAAFEFDNKVFAIVSSSLLLHRYQQRGTICHDYSVVWTRKTSINTAAVAIRVTSHMLLETRTTNGCRTRRDNGRL